MKRITSIAALALLVAGLFWAGWRGGEALAINNYREQVKPYVCAGTTGVTSDAHGYAKSTVDVPAIVPIDSAIGTVYIECDNEH